MQIFNLCQTALQLLPAHIPPEMNFNEVKGHIIFMPPDKIIGAATGTVFFWAVCGSVCTHKINVITVFRILKGIYLNLVQLLTGKARIWMCKG